MLRVNTLIFSISLIVALYFPVARVLAACNSLNVWDAFSDFSLESAAASEDVQTSLLATVINTANVTDFPQFSVYKIHIRNLTGSLNNDYSVFNPKMRCYCPPNEYGCCRIHRAITHHIASIMGYPLDFVPGPGVKTLCMVNFVGNYSLEYIPFYQTTTQILAKGALYTSTSNVTTAPMVLIYGKNTNLFWYPNVRVVPGAVANYSGGYINYAGSISPLTYDSENPDYPNLYRVDGINLNATGVPLYHVENNPVSPLVFYNSPNLPLFSEPMDWCNYRHGTINDPGTRLFYFCDNRLYTSVVTFDSVNMTWTAHGATLLLDLNLGTQPYTVRSVAMEPGAFLMPTMTATPTPTSTWSALVSHSSTPTLTASISDSSSSTPTPSPSASASHSISHSHTPSPSSTFSIGASVSSSASVSSTASATSTSSTGATPANLPNQQGNTITTPINTGITVAVVFCVVVAAVLIAIRVRQLRRVPGGLRRALSRRRLSPIVQIRSPVDIEMTSSVRSPLPPGVRSSIILTGMGDWNDESVESVVVASPLQSVRAAQSPRPTVGERDSTSDIEASDV